MAVAGTYAQYNPQLRYRTQKTYNIFVPDGGANPVDTVAQQLRNIRGKVTITISASDDSTNVPASFVVNGGYGEWPDDPTWNWYVITNTIVGCIVTQTVLNTFTVETLAPLVSRTYTITFNPRIAYPPTILLTDGTLLGTETLTVTQEKIN